MIQKLPRWAGVVPLAAALLFASACVMKDPKFSSASIPDAAQARDALMMIGTDGNSTMLNSPPSLCNDARFGRAAGRPASGAVTIPCWDGS